jgi:hypothetical protein
MNRSISLKNVSANLKALQSKHGISNDHSTGKLDLTFSTPQGQPAANTGWSNQIAFDVKRADANPFGRALSSGQRRQQRMKTPHERCD